jgi:uncharacterized membrane protein
MAWNWTLRLVLPVLMSSLASIIYEIAQQGLGVIDGVAVVFLAAALLVVSAWWLTTWLTPP